MVCPPQQNIILDGIKSNLRYEPTKETTNRKPCQREPNQVSDWELRIGVYRIYYNVDQVVQVVAIEQIGEKPNNTIFFRGKKRGSP